VADLPIKEAMKAMTNKANLIPTKYSFINVAKQEEAD
jgi:hypothetical protein